MMQFIKPTTKRISAIWTRENGNATIEFAFFFPLLVSLLLSTVEIGILTIRNTMLERAVDLTVRDLRLGKLTNPETGEGPTQDSLRELICERSSVVPRCRDRLLIELRPVSTVTWTPLASETTCRNSDLELNPPITFNPGASHQMVLIRVCAVFTPVFPTTKLGVHMSNDALGGYALVASSAFVNEPT